jgi:Chitobiase/beta-hexosaminidase C-terminal domain
MRVNSNSVLSFQIPGHVRRLFGSVLVCLYLLTLYSHFLQAQQTREASAGIAWQVKGTWQVEGKGAPILNGDVVQPQSLLQPDAETTPHSITVFLPDGQRILYECFTVEDCARGFRVPSLYRRPQPFAVAMLARIRSVLVSGNHDSSTNPTTQGEPELPRDEVLAVLGPDNRVTVGGLVSRLSNGHYTYDLRPLDPAYPSQSHLTFEKKAPTISLSLPSSGLFVLTITDDLHSPRINLFLAVVRPAQAASITKSFHDAKELMEDWNGDYGWPVHDFRRAYLESLLSSAKPLNAGGETGLPGKFVSNARTSAAGVRPGVTAEPSFFPKPGVFAGDTAVTLRCATQSATIHYTVDSSQPTAHSPVNSAPIMVKGTELTIKAFASAPGKKDSAVVTGIFRISQ